MRIHGGQCGQLTGMRGTDEHVLGQTLDLTDVISGTTIQPTRQPVIEKYFENELIT